MNNAHKQMRDWLRQIINKFKYVSTLNDQLEKFDDWRTPKKLTIINMGAGFFWLMNYSFMRSILIELYLLLADREVRSLPNWLKDACRYAGNINPTRDISDGEREREVISSDEYRIIVGKNLDLLAEHSELIGKIQIRRDKILAHWDKKYFNNPNKIDLDSPLSKVQLKKLINSISDILRDQCVFLLEYDPCDFIVSEGPDLEVIMKHMSAKRAFKQYLALEAKKQVVAARREGRDI